MIRAFTPNDLDPVMRLWLKGNLEAHPFIGAGYWQGHYEEVRALLPKATIFVSLSKGIVQGFVGLDDSYIAGIFVEAASQSQGVGRALLSHVKERGPRLWLRVYKQNDRAVAFYKREGFAVEREQLEEETGQVELVMAWNE